MQRVVEVLLGAFLRRYPLPTRVSMFSFLSRYAWLKDILEELRPELFPPPREGLEPEAIEPASPTLDTRILGILERSEIQGRRGYYKAQTYLGARGNGHLFSAIETTSKQPVVIKEFLLAETNFTRTEALHRQSSFQRLGGLQLADGRLQDFRVIQPLEAIADSESQELCFLVTPDVDRAPTLHHHLLQVGTLDPEQVQDVVSQVLQTLDFLHSQKFNLPSGALQNGLIHGNLSLNSILWAEQSLQPYVYLCDLLLWEQYFDPITKSGRSTQATPEAIQHDLRAVGAIGFTLLQGLDPNPLNLPNSSVTPPQKPVLIEPALRLILDSLQTGKYDSAETARRELLKLATRSPGILTPAPTPTLAEATPTRKWSPLLLLGLLGLLAGALVFLPRWRSQDSQSIAAPQINTCCLAEVSAIPAGNFRYTSIKGGTWWTVLQQKPGLTDRLGTSQPKLNLAYVPVASFDQLFAEIRSGAADFAVLPLAAPLPSDMLAQEIAYDGLATVVSFSYAKRKQGLPTTLNGQLDLAQVRQIFTGEVDRWEAIAESSLSVQRYISSNPDVIAMFEQQVLKGRPLETLPKVKPLPPLELLRQVIRDFETENVGSIGITAISEMWGQCSVYPLAIRNSAQVVVQPLVLSNGQEITPETDLCDRKGAYAPEPTRIQTGAYPFSYPILVVYPRDNRRSAIGKKFVELMRTVEGQKLLKAAGLVPLSQMPQSTISTQP